MEEGVFYVKVDHQNAASAIRCVEFYDPDITGKDGEHITKISQPALTSNAVRIGEVVQHTDGYGYLKLHNGKATLTCTLTLREATTNHMGIVNVAATYYVQDSARTTFSVTHSGT